MENVQKKTGVFIDRNGDKTMKGIKVIQVCKNKFKKTASDNTGLNILRFIQMMLTFIIIAFLNYGIFAYATPYVPNKIRWGLSLAWFGLALTVNKKFVKTFLAFSSALSLFSCIITCALELIIFSTCSRAYSTAVT